MRLPDRVNTDYLTLALLELAAVPLVVLVTVIVLFLGGGSMQLLRAVGGELSLGTTVVDVLLQLVVLVTTLVLFAMGAGVVRGYREFFDRSEGTVDALVLLAVPLLGVVGPFAYALGNFGSLSMPNWLFVIAVAAAHALSFRAIALYSRGDDHRRMGLLVGSAAALPIVLLLVAILANDVFVTGDILSTGVNEVASQLLGVVTWTDLPLHRPLVIGLPVLIATLYAGYRAQTGEQQQSALPSLLGSQRSIGGLFSVTKILQQLPGRRSSSSKDGSGDERSRWQRKSDSNGRRASRSDGSGGRRSDSRSRPKRRRSPHRSSGGSSDNTSRRSSSSRSTDRNRSPSSSTGQSDSTASRDSNSSSADSRSGGTGREASGSTGASESQQSSGSANQSKSSSGGEDASTGSDTRIFTDDFGEYGGGTGSVDCCPACDKETPSDGVYEFCPFCGQEL